MKVRNEPLSIDANVILRYVLQDHDDLSAKASRIMHAVQEGRLTVICDPVIFAEVVWVLASYYRFPREKIYECLFAILKDDGFLVPDKTRCVRALELFSTSVPHFGDACACAAALEDCEGRLLSFDKELDQAERIQRREIPD